MRNDTTGPTPDRRSHLFWMTAIPGLLTSSAGLLLTLHLFRSGMLQEAQKVHTVVLLGGVALSVLLGIDVAQMVSRHMRAEGIVGKRTGQLRHAMKEIARLSLVVEQSPFSVIITDTEGVIEYVNPSFTRITGYPAEEAIGQTPAILRAPNRPVETIKELWQTIQAGNRWEGELENRKKNGDPVWQRLVIAPILNDAGKITHYASSQEDITEKRLLHEQLMQSQKMEMVGKLVGGVAHDFNNMLTAILGSADLLRSDLKDREDGPAAHIETLDAIIDAGNRAATLTLQLLMFGRKKVADFHPMDLTFFVRETYDFLQRTLGADIKLEMRLKKNIGTVLADQGHVNQILMNLAVNARDAMPYGGTLSIRTERTGLMTEESHDGQVVPPGEYVMLTVADTGYGMTEDVRQRIFEPFFTTKGMVRSSGIGLPMVLGSVQRMKGHIVVHSEPRKGTRFQLYFPVHSDAVEVEQDTDEMLTGDRATALVLDDEDAVRKVLAHMLRALGYDVLTAGNAGEARAVFEERGGEIDLVLADIVMPSEMGPDVIDELRASSYEPAVIYTSGFTEHPRVHEQRTDRTVFFIQKPFSRDALGSAVRHALTNRQRATAVSHDAGSHQPG